MSGHQRLHAAQKYAKAIEFLVYTVSIVQIINVKDYHCVHQGYFKLHQALLRKHMLQICQQKHYNNIKYTNASL